MVQLLQMRGISFFKYLQNDLIRTWIQTDTLCGNKAINKRLLTVFFHFIINEKHKIENLTRISKGGLLIDLIN